MTDLNDRIAKAKGWTHIGGYCWHNPDGHEWPRPDFTSSLEFVAGMMRGLNEKARKDGQYWWWGQNASRLVDAPRDAFVCVRHGKAMHTLFLVPWFWSPDGRPGDCVGEAWMSVFGKGA